MVEVVTAALEDQLIDPLSFRLTKTHLILQKTEIMYLSPPGVKYLSSNYWNKTYKNSTIRDRLVRPKHISYNV